MTSKLGFTAFAAAVFLCLPPAHAAATGGDDAWNLMKTLIGEWQAGTSEGNSMAMSYQLISNGSAILETMKEPGGGAFMITVYHRDGADLMATHYCAIGNQPRMRAAAPTATGKRIDFRFVDVTNLKSPGDGHISGVAISFKDADHIEELWGHRANGKETAGALFKLTRLKSAPAKAAK